MPNRRDYFEGTHQPTPDERFATAFIQTAEANNYAVELRDLSDIPDGFYAVAIMPKTEHKALLAISNQRAIEHFEHEFSGIAYPHEPSQSLMLWDFNEHPTFAKGRTRREALLASIAKLKTIITKTDK